MRLSPHHLPYCTHMYVHVYTVYWQRTLTEQQRASLTSDFESLNLSKYIQEAVS